MPTRVNQKLINKNDVKPISSQPKKSKIKLPEITKTNMLKTKALSKRIKRSTLGSYLKYENVKKTTKRAIVVVKNIKLNEIRSIKNSNFTSKKPFNLNHLKRVSCKVPFLKRKKSIFINSEIQKTNSGNVQIKKIP